MITLLTMPYFSARGMTLLSCQLCTAEKGDKAKKYNTLNQLKYHLRQDHKKYMCEVCLEGRKVP